MSVGCSTVAGLNRVSKRRSPLPEKRYQLEIEELPEGKRYLYSGWRFFWNDVTYLSAYAVFYSAYTVVPVLGPLWLTEGILTGLVDTIIAPVTWTLDELHLNKLNELPLAMPVPVHLEQRPTKQPPKGKKPAPAEGRRQGS